MSPIDVLAAPLAFAPPTDGGGGNPFMGLFPLVLIMFIFYFLIIRPQQRRQKEHQQMLRALSRGDRVLTNGGLYATVVDVKDDLVVVSISEGVKVEIAKHAVAGKVAIKTKGEAKPAAKGKSKNKADKEDEASA